MRHFSQQIIQSIEQFLGQSLSDVSLDLADPPNPQLGDLALACFPISKLLKTSPVEVSRKLADADWDLEQTRESLRPFLLEEAHEVSEAILQGDPRKVCEELGDLLMNVFLQARVAEEQNDFTLEKIAEEISDKLIRRHPHVFGDANAENPEEVRKQWERIKQEEKNEDGEATEVRSTIRSLPASLPALSRADRVGKMVAELTGSTAGALAKVEEERFELAEALAEGDEAAVEHEIGDLLFAVSSVARKCGVDPETALNRALRRFEDRFRTVDRQLGDRPHASLEELEEWYQQGKWDEGIGQESQG